MKIEILCVSDDIIEITGDCNISIPNINQNKGLALIDSKSNKAMVVNFDLSTGYWRLSHNGDNLGWDIKLERTVDGDDVLAVNTNCDVIVSTFIK